MIPDLIDFDTPALPQPSWGARVNYSRATDRPIQQTRDGDSELMQRVRDGDQGSFELLLEKHRGPMIHFLHRMVQNDAVAEELSQEVFLRVFKSRGSYQPSAKFTTWLFRIGTHLALNWIRDGRNEKLQTSLDKETPDGTSRRVPARARNTQQELLYQAKLREVRQASQCLPAKQRAAVMMQKSEEMEYAQIASGVGCSKAGGRPL